VPGITPPHTLPRPVVRNLIDDDTDSAVMPLHGLQRPWDAPFFYADSRHVFLVSTAERIVRLLDWDGFTPGTVLEDPVLALPRLVQPELPIPPRPVPGVDGSTAPIGTNQLRIMRRFVTEDVYIRRAIGTPGTVRFGDTEIGPAGGILHGDHRG
jgi:hypothetical protein